MKKVADCDTITLMARRCSNEGCPIKGICRYAYEAVGEATQAGVYSRLDDQAAHQAASWVDRKIPDLVVNALKHGCANPEEIIEAVNEVWLLGERRVSVSEKLAKEWEGLSPKEAVLKLRDLSIAIKESGGADEAATEVPWLAQRFNAGMARIGQFNEDTWKELNETLGPWDKFWPDE